MGGREGVRKEREVDAEKEVVGKRRVESGEGVGAWRGGWEKSTVGGGRREEKV